MIDYLGFAANLDNFAQFGDAIVFRAADIFHSAAMAADSGRERLPADGQITARWRI